MVVQTQAQAASLPISQGALGTQTAVRGRKASQTSRGRYHRLKTGRMCNRRPPEVETPRSKGAGESGWNVTR